MPTPFTHLEIAQRLLRDEAIPQPMRDLLLSERGAFLLGSVAADARVGVGAPRAQTHFYDYRDGITEHPWRVMIEQNPALLTPHHVAQRVFVAGYVAHLAVDEIWSKEMVGPHFAMREWAEQRFRFYMLHIILIHMDERDLPHIEPWQAKSLHDATPENWLAFISDQELRQWRDFIYEQIKPGGESLTLQIFGERITRTPEEMRAFLDSPEEMQSGLWDHISPQLLHDIETRMYTHARDQMMIYLQESGA